MNSTHGTQCTACSIKIKAVLFDLGETLLNFGKINTVRLFRQGARLSYDFLRGIGQPVGSFNCYFWRGLINIRVRHWLTGITGNDFDALTVLKTVGTKAGLNLSDEQWRHLAWMWYEPFSKVCRVEPDIADTLAELKKMGLKLGIVSNTFIHSSSLERHLEQLGILDFFDFRLYSYQFDFRKPDARIFKAAAERIGEMLENILFVGDRIDKDIKPALKAGMQAVLKTAYTNVGRSVPAGVRRIDNLGELPALIAGY